MSKCTTCHEADGTPHDWWSEGCYGPCTAGRNGHEAAFRTWSIRTDKAAAKEARLPCSWLGALLGVHPVIVRLAPRTDPEALPTRRPATPERAGREQEDRSSWSRLHRGIARNLGPGPQGREGLPVADPSEPVRVRKRRNHPEGARCQGARRAGAGCRRVPPYGYRPFPDVFRKALLEAYGGRCAFSRRVRKRAGRARTRRGRSSCRRSSPSPRFESLLSDPERCDWSLVERKRVP